MKNTLAVLALLLFIGTFTLGRPSGFAYEVGHLRLTGKLLPTDAQQNGDQRGSIEASIDGTRWIFEVAKAETLKGGGAGGWSILRQLFPARMTIRGNGDLLDEIRREEGSGRDIAVTGFLYPASRVFFVTSLKKLDGRS